MTGLGRFGRWRHLRPTSRDADLADGLSATVHDPLWLLSRQWHVGEFRGEDAGSPVDVDVTVEHDALNRFERRGDGGGDVVPYEGGPLESAIERERVLTADPPARVAAEAGTAFLELLADGGITDDGSSFGATDFDPAYRLSKPKTPMPDADRRFYDVMAGRALDGALVYDALARARATDWSDLEDVPLPDGVTLEDADIVSSYTEVGDAYCAWYVDLYDEPEDSGDAWRPTRLEYDAAIVTGSGADENTFELAGYRGGRLSWDAFSPTADALGDLDSGSVEGEGTGAEEEEEESVADPLESTVGSDDAAGSTPERWLVPTPVTFPGMPSPRWWEVEDAGLLFGDVALDGLNLVRLLVHEFALTYGNDWFRVPLEDVPVGSLTRIPAFSVTDSFGLTDEVTSAEDDDWRLFSHDLPNDAHHQGLFLPPTVSDALESDPVESVLFGRDSMANLVFALERLVEGTTGDPVDRTEFTRPRIEIARARADEDPDEEFVELVNPGDDVFGGGDLRLETEAGGEADAYTVIDGEALPGPGERLRVYSGGLGARDGIGAGVAESVLTDAEAVSLVRPEESGVSETDEDADDTLSRWVVAKRPLTSVDDADADYRLSSTVPDHWFPLTVELEGEGELGVDDGGDGEEPGWDYRLLLSVLLDAESLDRPLEEIPTPEGRILDPDPETLPAGERALKLHEETVTRSGRTVDRRYQYVHWADGTVHLWSGRTSRPGYGELRSALRFDTLDGPEE